MQNYCMQDLGVMSFLGDLWRSSVHHTEVTTNHTTSDPRVLDNRLHILEVQIQFARFFSYDLYSLLQKYFFPPTDINRECKL